MRKTIFILLVASFLSSCTIKLITSAPSPSNKQLQTLEAYPVDEIIAEIQKQYTLALATLSTEGITDFKISKAELSLAVTETTTGNGDIAVIVGGGFEAEQVRASTYKLTLEKNAAGGAANPKFIPNNNLSSFIVSSIKKTASIKNYIEDLNKPTVELTVKLTIKKEKNGKISFDIVGVTLDGGVTHSTEVEHELTLTFERG